MALPQLAGGNEREVVFFYATEEVVALLHLAFEFLIVAHDAAGAGVGLVFREAIECLAHSFVDIAVVGILLFEQIAIIESAHIFGIDNILSHTLEACQSTDFLKFRRCHHHKPAAAFGITDDGRCGLASFEDVGVGAERVVVVVARGDRVDLIHKVVRRHLVVGCIEIGGVEHQLVEGEIAVLQHIEYALGDILGVRAGQVEHLQAQAVGLALHLARAVVVFDKVTHLLRLGLYVIAVALASRDFFETVLAQVVDNLVADDEGQLGLILDLCHEASAYEDHTLPGGESIDIWRL